MFLRSEKVFILLKEKKMNQNAFLAHIGFAVLVLLFFYFCTQRPEMLPLIVLFLLSVIFTVLYVLFLSESTMDLIGPIAVCVLLGVFLARQWIFRDRRDVDDLDPSFLIRHYNSPVNEDEIPLPRGMKPPQNSPLLSNLSNLSTIPSLLRSRHSPTVFDTVRKMSSPQRLRALSLQQFELLSRLPEWQEEVNHLLKEAEEGKEEMKYPVNEEDEDDRKEEDRKEDDRKEMVHEFLHAEEIIEQGRQEGNDKLVQRGVKMLHDMQERIQEDVSAPRRFYGKMMGIVSTALTFAAMGATIYTSLSGNNGDDRRWDGRGNVLM